MNESNDRYWVLNTSYSPTSVLPRDAAPPLSNARPIDLHRTMPGYRQTPLISLPDVARDLGLASVWVKDESCRLGLPAFKMLGASWATYRALAPLCPTLPPPDLSELAQAVADADSYTLVTATDGNHGRAVARMASYLNLHSRILVPSSVSDGAIELIKNEGAHVSVLECSYDATVQAAADLARDNDKHLLIQDTSWPGYEDVPQWIVEGYSTLFEEADTQLPDLDGVGLLELVPTGVGSLAHAAALHTRHRSERSVITVEPTAAPCLTTSLATGRLVSVRTGETSMDGLNCGTPSALAFPDLLSSIQASICVTDTDTSDAQEQMRAHGVNAEPCGAASLAGLYAIARDPHRRHGLGIHASTSVLLLNTEGR